MKRIEDLKENECIEIRNKKEAKAVQKLAKLNFVIVVETDSAYPFYFFPYDNIVRPYLLTVNKNYKVSDFIPKKKSLKKIVKESEKRINELEKRSIHVDFNAYFAELKSRYFIKQNPH